MAPKPHIVIVATGDGTWLGGRQYAINLVRALLACRADSDAFDVSVLVKGKGEIVHYEPVRAGLRECLDIEDVLADWTLSNRVRWKIKRLQGWTNPRFEEALLRLGATYAYPASVSRVASAAWIPDFQYYNFPEATSAADRRERRIEAETVAAHAQRIVLSSAAVERDCHEVFPETVGRTQVLEFRAFAEPSWLEPDPEGVRKKYNLPERYALISNWMVPTKNHMAVLDALATLSKADREPIHVVCTGDIYDYRNPTFYHTILDRLHTRGLRNNVSFMGIIPKVDQIQLLRAATVYLQPSLHEGWNTGVEEARMFGKRILLSDIPVHREQAPPRTTYFDPRDPIDLGVKLRGVFAEPELSGADAIAEQAALDAYGKLQVEFGRKFLSFCL